MSSTLSHSHQTGHRDERNRLPAGGSLDARAERSRREAPLRVALVMRDVDALLTSALEDLGAEWAAHVSDIGCDVLPDDVPRWLSDLLVGRGKRMRVVIAYWGFIAAGGVHGSPAYSDLVRVAAALEALHLFALIHDDVMDESATRRGRAAAHVQAEGWHSAERARGEGSVFGRNMAILLGDFAHMLADHLVDELPRPMRRAWYRMSMELIAGQRADLTGAAAGRRDHAHAEKVAVLKTGRYTVVRPLELAGLAAGAETHVVKALMESGDHIGRAFALRDEYLGVWGDPQVTGKPASDDLLEGKATVLISVARDRLTGEAAAMLPRLGTPGADVGTVSRLAQAMHAAGVGVELEHRIGISLQAGLDRLGELDLDEAGVAGIAEAANAMAWRNA